MAGPSQRNLPLAKRQKVNISSPFKPFELLNLVARLQEDIQMWSRQNESPSEKAKPHTFHTFKGAEVLSEIARGSVTDDATGEAFQDVFASLMQNLEEDSHKLQAVLDLNSLPDVPEYCTPKPSIEAAKRIVNYAHRLSYTTFAPATVLGQNLFRPPAPQDWDFRASILHTISSDIGGQSRQDLLPMAMRQSSAEIPEMECQSVLEPRLEEGREPPADTSGIANEAAPPVQKATPFISSAFDFILNPDLEEADEEFSSSDAEEE